ncbi:DUF1499 domain-containing protein [Aquamicrobium segne]|uniref:DUF1499 domain-containing protein n=1 Tax=Aquamicrobium segne TaxID=469547 RepID=A0ABW0GWP7_9HYPH
MTEFPRQQTSMAAGWSRRMAAFSAVLLLTVWTGHHFGLVETPAYLWVLALVALLAALALLFSGWAFARLWSFGGHGGRDLSVGALIALLVLTPYAGASYRALTLPPLHDISTDLDTAPALADGRSFEATPGEQRLQMEAYPLANSHHYSLPYTEAVSIVRNVFEQQGWADMVVTELDDAELRETLLTASATSFILKLPVDVGVRITGDEETSLVDMRSASRYGRHDLGDNGDRIVGFLEEIEQAVAGLSGIAPGQ